mgnify:FL=1
MWLTPQWLKIHKEGGSAADDAGNAGKDIIDGAGNAGKDVIDGAAMPEKM